MRSGTVLVFAATIQLGIQCPPQPNGNCYAGTFSGGQPQFQNQRCPEDPYRDWCAVTYQPASAVASFGCASSFPSQLGTPQCGDGALSINQQGCNMVNTAAGPCYLCCCKGGSCNHPREFAEQARLQLGSSPYREQLQVWGNTALSNASFPIFFLLFIYF